MPEYTWIAHPDVISKAIYILASSVVVLGGTLIKVFLYIDGKRMGMLQSVAEDVRKIAVDLQNYTLHGEHRLTMVETRVERLEGDTNDIRRICEDRRNHEGMHS